MTGLKILHPECSGEFQFSSVSYNLKFHNIYTIQNDKHNIQLNTTCKTSYTRPIQIFQKIKLT